MRNFIFTYLLILGFTFSACSQTATKSLNIQTINGKKFYLHKVEKGQSLYAISKLYEIDLNAIVIENPDAIDGIKPGQELKVPFEKPKTDEFSPADYEKYQIHKVAKGETLYSISKKYNVTEESIAALNPLAKNGLKEGQQLKIVERKKQVVSNNVSNSLPGEAFEMYKVEKGETVYAITKKFGISADDFYLWNPEAKSGVKVEQMVRVGAKKPIKDSTIKQNVVALVDTIVATKKPVYNIGIMMPFQFNETDFINVDQLVKDKQDFPSTQTIALELYQGIKYAIDSLQTADCKFNIQLFDTQDRDSAQVFKVVKENGFRELDLCIGPVYNSSFKVVAENAKELGIPIVTPLTQQNKVLFDNVFASKTTPSNFTLIETLAEFVVDSFRTHNVVMINSGKPKEQALMKAFKLHYNDYLSIVYDNSKDTVQEVKGLAGAKSAYNPNKKNYYVIISEDEVYLTDFLTQLNTFIDKKKELNVIGLRKWISLEHLDSEYLNKFNFLYPSSYFIDYSSEFVKKAKKAYYATYFTDPEDYYYQGIDIALYYLEALKKYGPDFYKNLDQYKKKGAVMDFNFFRPSQTTGFDNRSLKMVRYSDYKYSKAN
ncbi:MAG: LysM peptidoglycan-binding domain-containing protein [Bacteroidetes bacterium]|nr:LysM peptidoglycan-binding domain-containing protein [Bacteroidota bacterium]